MRDFLVLKAVRFFHATVNDGIPVATKIDWLKTTKGLTDTEVLEALNQAGDGELVRAALDLTQEAKPLQ